MDETANLPIGSNLWLLNAIWVSELSGIQTEKESVDIAEGGMIRGPYKNGKRKTCPSGHDTTGPYSRALDGSCRECRREWRARPENRERAKAYFKAWYARKHERV